MQCKNALPAESQKKLMIYSSHLHDVHSNIIQALEGHQLRGHRQKLTDRGKVAENMTVCLSGRMLPTMRVI